MPAEQLSLRLLEIIMFGFLQLYT